MIVLAWQLWIVIMKRCYQWPQENSRSKNNLEEISLEHGGPRVKFKANWIGTLDDFFDIYPECKSQYEVFCREMCHQLQALEELGATPVLPDGKVGGNAGAVLETVKEEPFIVCSKSGKTAKTKLNPYTDFTVVQSFDEKNWSCHYYSPDSSILPTSDSPLHYYSLIKACYELDWSKRPRFLLHGHAFETEADAEKLNLPISKEETLFSTREDSEALFKLLNIFPYPENKVYIRKGHGFVLLAGSGKEAWRTFEKYMKSYLVQ